jgi:hypothetical protein
LVNQGRDDYTLHESVNLNPAPAKEEATGYSHSRYSQSLSQFGTPRFLPESGGWILERQIPRSPHIDAMGCYPLFACQDWSLLHVDLNGIGNSLVCLSLVTDPFGEYDLSYLQECFPDVLVSFKDHFVVDLSRPAESFVQPHHLRNARKAQSAIDVELCARPVDFLDDWIALYEMLVKRHSIKGIAAFSKEAFAEQLNVPGLVALRAVHDETTEGMLLWYVQGPIAYYHLGAYSERGYDLRASFALFRYAIDYFARTGLRWLDLGGAAGAGDAKSSGLGRFKKGWSTGVRTAYFCGRIFDQARYTEILSAQQVPPTNYFPAYRDGEFF